MADLTRPGLPWSRRFGRYLLDQSFILKLTQAETKIFQSLSVYNVSTVYVFFGDDLIQSDLGNNT
jgi:hypothetical protein